MLKASQQPADLTAQLKQMAADAAEGKTLAVDVTLAANTVRVSAGHPSTAALGAVFGTLSIERA